ncbi:YMD3-like protein [Mya arenaria]|uniref:YMD3-like protein n=1 Tax=Mya arenaria TaxID=6604 RepID=A0ABY7EA21_MYAAR|nr:YMD3-like protein [Mya arenaria]
MKRGKCLECGSTKTQFVKGAAAPHKGSHSGSGVMSNLINKLPFEMHLPGHNFTGPGTNFNKRLNKDMTPKPWSVPISRDDNATYNHDVCHAKNKDTGTRNRVCDKNMIEEMDGIYNPSLRERFDQNIIGTKVNFEMVWTNQLANELHKRKRRVYVKGIDEIWASDLVDMQSFSRENKIVKYPLTVIDVFSMYGWMIPLKDKTEKYVADALKQIIKEQNPKKMWVDKGKEFYNKDVQNLVEIYSMENEEKSSVVERWNRKMKEKMWKYFSGISTNKYIDILNDLVDQYNETKHSSIKMTPVEASMKKNENRVYKYLYTKPARLTEPLAMLRRSQTSKPKFAVGDRVRITKKKKTFEKGYIPRWTEEVFTVSEIQYTNPVTYTIKDYNKEEIQGTFYEQELQKTDQDIF